ncbi:unnamed protein product [Eruca vesicaria subsp. sativa]|uniref:Uncharacterized protein n=1 Tax=Eruca vesicaria subsp. sativa TaxID=29727 RepID=A0ABC8JD73_ERUVS|nr:unnamed protein product [Eruca vesicaria subsp. sativa]
MKTLAPFSSHRLRQRISTVYPTAMTFLSRPSSSTSIIKSRSEENLTKLNECMDNMDDDVSKMFMECHQTDFRHDPELLRLLNEYFTTSKSVTSLCESLRKCLEKAEHDECFLLDETLRDFEEEKNGCAGLLEASFRKTVIDLRKFNENGVVVVGDDFLEKVQICHQDLAEMIVKLEATMKEIDKKLRRVRGKRAVITAAIIAPVIALATVSKIVAGIFGSVPVGEVTNFAASKWKKSTATLKREKTAVTSMERATMVALKEVERIGRLVSRLEAVERSIRVTADFAVKKRSSVAVAMGGMERERKRLKSTLVDLDRETGRCDGFVEFGRTLAKDKIFEFLSCGEKKL